jgi:cysteinyl-tRNA synthetase
MKLYNTLTRKIDDFNPQGDTVLMYTCGPTVYDTAHIGNLRTYLFEDILRRTLEYNGLKVSQTMNITDIDDKTICKSGGDLKKFKELTKKYEELFFADLKELNILPATQITRATEYIDKMVVFIEDLIKKGFAYKASDGSVYFSIAKFKDYGKLSHLDASGLKSGARVAQDEYDKENPADFALWKAYDESDGEIFYETSLGKGRPGWHIECSVMAKDSLGDSLDIHAGAVDLIFPHHENEIAQSEAHTGKKFANFWIHGEHLLVDNKKMSKSLGNFYTLADLKAKGFSPLDFRYFTLLGHYRSKLNFTWTGLEAAKNALNNLRDNIIRLQSLKDLDHETLDQAETAFKNAINDDLNAPQALGVLQKLITDANKAERGGEALIDLIHSFDQVLALDLITDVHIPQNITDLAKQRVEAKKSGDFELADDLRGQINAAGFEIEDSQDSFKMIPR